MSDYNHASSVQGSNKNTEDDYRWKEKTMLLRTKLEKHRERFGQLVLNQNMEKGHEEERHRRS